MKGLRAELSAWEISIGVALILFLAPLAVAGGLAILWTVDAPLAFSVIDEDGAVEWVQVAAYLTATVSAALAARSLSGTGAAAWASVYLALAAGCVLIVGEELNWGQRVLGFETPGAWPGSDPEAPTAVHNVASLGHTYQGLLLLFGLYGTFSPWAVLALRRCLPRLNPVLRNAMVVVPPVFVSSSFLILLTQKLVMVAGADDDRMRNQFYGEVEELALAFGLAAFAVLSYRRLRNHGGRRIPASNPGHPHG
jgi:hypothetical protein